MRKKKKKKKERKVNVEKKRRARERADGTCFPSCRRGSRLVFGSVESEPILLLGHRIPDEI